ncbi:MAG: hypothetical protein NC092_10550 [Butyrivibrio sp.]|nr:hypothetical protein [Muribaculum sp.]MCM1553119.1 hypothetical protein [Butyrivibrio sp.]
MGVGHAVVLFREYMGTGLVVIWFLVCLIYLFLREERKELRILLVYVPMILLLLFFNPLFARIVMAYMGDEIYYRIIWLLPMTVVIAYTCVTVGGRLGGRKRLAFAVSAVILTIVSGKYIYNNAYYGRAENLYHMPESVVHICDAIEIPGREVTAVFPLDMVQYVRQYSPVVCMPYGREILVEAWNEWAVQNALCDAMEAETVEAAELGRLAREQSCIYIVLPASKEVRGNLQETGYEYFDEMDGYVIYKDKFF